MDVYGNIYNKSINYAFDEQAERFGKGAGCVTLKKGVKYLPRDTKCDVPMQIICKWKGKQLFFVIERTSVKKLYLF